MEKRFAAVVATVVAGMFAANLAAAEDKAGTRTKETSSKVKCSGINECKGKGECAGPGHACAGHNECKGKGWITKESEQACKDAGGTVASSARPKKQLR